MSLDEINFLSELIFQVNGGFGIIEIGEETKQLGVILSHNAYCWGIGYVKVDVINKMYLCNNFNYEKFELIDREKPIETDKVFYENSEKDSFWSFNLFGSTYAQEIVKEKVDSKEIKKIVHADVEKIKLIRRHHYANKKRMRKHHHRKIVGNKVVIDMTKVKDDIKKYECKYRKSCYETGELNLDIVYHDPIKSEEEEVAMSVDQLKVLCKYRKSCYDSAGISKDEQKLLEEDVNKDQGLLSVKRHVIKATKKTKKSLKNIAAKALKKSEMKAHEKKKLMEEIKEDNVVEKMLQENSELFKKKAECKFRKSCYETGELPPSLQKNEVKENEESYEEIIQRYWDLLEEKLHFDIDFNIVNTKSFDELEDNEKKLKCHYRKSCYETGIVPEISDEIFEPPVNEELAVDPIFNSLEEDRKLACKYRKSCYETGVIPEIIPPPVVIEEPKEEIVPLNENDFRVYCKFRKSCYADAAKLVKDDNEEEKVKETIVETEKIEEVKVPDENIKKKEKKPKNVERVEEVNEIEKTKKNIDEEEPRPKKKVSKIDTDADIEKPSKVKSSKKSRKEEKNEEIYEPDEPIRKPKKVKVKKEDKQKVVEEVPVVEEPKKIKKLSSKKEAKVKTPKVVIEEAVVEVASKTEEKVKKHKEGKNKKPKVEINIEESSDEKIEKPLEEEPKKVKKSKPKKDTKQLKIDEIEQPENKTFYEQIDVDKYLEYAYHFLNTVKNFDYNSYLKSESPSESTEVKKHTYDSELEAKKFQCHYRKSCYETGIIPKLTPQIFAPHISPDSGEVKEVQHTYDPESENKKLKCKYRKSCYETGELPEISVHIFETPIYEKKEESEPIDSEGDGKLDCKYRKSCYETGHLPIIEHKSHTPIVVENEDKAPEDEEQLKYYCKYRKSCYETGVLPDLNEEHEYHEVKDVEDAPHSEVDMKYHCKYRKSCYDVSEDNDKKVEDVEEIKKKDKEPEETQKKPKIYSKQYKKEKVKIINETEPVKEIEIIDVTLETQELKDTSNIKPNCNPFRISCKKLLGLPLSEKAPRAKNGKKLCRKKKPSTTT
uniref:SH3 domain-containing protein n=1 Tax=Parastrongyloides trichosuri TaxID=131310 RepID=A0A0N4Z6S0_PARTI